MLNKNIILDILTLNRNNFDQIIKALFNQFHEYYSSYEPHYFCKMEILDQLPKQAQFDIYSLDRGQWEAKICYSGMYFKIEVHHEIKIEMKDKLGQLHNKTL